MIKFYFVFNNQKLISYFLVIKMLSVDTQNAMCDFFRALADLELNVESYRQKLAAQYDFEPYAAFCRLDADGDKNLYTVDFYNFLHENDRK